MRKKLIILIMSSAAVLGLMLSGCGSNGSTSATPSSPACAYTYGVWGACQLNSTQTRTVLTATPSGCTGTPLLSQSCAFTPVTLADVEASCTICHSLKVNTTQLLPATLPIYTISGETASYWLGIVNGMIGYGASLASGTTAQDYANFLAALP